MPLPDFNAVNVSFHQSSAAGVGRRGRHGAFALVITLLILSLLVVVAVSYLSSMVGERQTADAYSAKARAEQVAQAGVDSAMAILAQSFRDFPDSATVWDTQQSQNDGKPANPAIVNTTYNEGTSLYLRAVDAGGTANPLPKGMPAPGETPVPANDPGSNNPNNPACKNFVLPLISGVPSGQAQLVSKKATIFPAKMGVDANDPAHQSYVNPNDPAQQNFTDLNVRRFAGDLQGVIGSPPDWSNVGPKPARAYWVNLKDSTGHKTGRYAFWIEDESFRTNVNYLGNTDNGSPQRADNSANGASLPRSVQPQDMFLSGALAGFPTVFSPAANAQSVLDTRNQYPGSFLPEPLAFTHVANGSASPSPTTLPVPVVDGLRYLTTTQSGSLNLTRHGTQRLNLNAPTTIKADTAVTMTEIRKLVETIRFHLPNFGQRFYRTTNTATGAVLNKPDDVKADPMTGFNNAEIYLYKTAANLRDYIDADDQPTMIVRPHDGLPSPSLWAPGTTIYHPFGGDGAGGNGPNYMWAQGKEGAPFLQEAMVRYRPAVQNSGVNYTLTVDYYVEFWNMSDHDVTAAQLGSPYVRISNQQTWWSAYIPATNGKPTPNAAPSRVAPLTVPLNDPGVAPGVEGLPRDFNMDLVNGVFRADNPTVAVPTTTGVVFKAGTATVITSDPDYVAYTDANSMHRSPVTGSVYAYGGQALGTAGFIPTNVYYCSNTAQGTPPIAARRVYSGETGLTTFRPGYLRGIMPHFNPQENAGSTYLDFEVEVTLANNLGYLDCATGAFCIAAGSSDAGTNGYGFTWTASGDPHNDYLHGGTLGGNGYTASELGDPRTNNEQLYIRLYAGSSFPAEPDQYRYGSPGKTLLPPFSLGTPNSQYLKPANTTAGYIPWGDYYDWPGTATYPAANPTATTAPSVIANSALTSIGQLGDIFDPARVIGSVGSPVNIDYSRGGGRTLKIGQRDDRHWYDPSSNTIGNNAPGNNAADNVPNSNGWASWRLTDVFGISDALELPARININGVNRDGGAALRAALTGFKFQPLTSTDPLIHGVEKLASAPLKMLPTDSTGVSKLVSDIKTRLALTTASANTPYGPFFERGELGELESSAGVALFGKNVSSAFSVSQDLAVTTTGTAVDLNHTFDRGREELFRRVAELTCTRGDTFTVYAVGQSMTQPDPTKPAKITSTHRMRVTFRLVPKQYKDLTQTTVKDFHPGTLDTTDYSLGGPSDFDPTAVTGLNGLNTRFAKPDLYDVQVLEVNTL